MKVSKFHFLLTCAALGAAGLGANVLAATCPGGAKYETVDYFKPAKADYAKYIDQGGYHLSLCNAAHATPGPNATCHSIDLKAYLYLPATAAHGAHLPLVLWVDGSWANPANSALPNPQDYPTACSVGSWFAKRGYVVLAIVRRGYKPSTGENEVVREANSTADFLTQHEDVITYLANESFETQVAVEYMSKRKATDGVRLLIDPKKIGYVGHSLGGIAGLFFGTTGNKPPIIDAGVPSGLTKVKAKVLIAPASQSWDGFDLEDGQYDDTSVSIERLKTAAQHSLLPTYFLEPLNDQSYRPAALLGKAAADFQLTENQSCRMAIAPPGGGAPSDAQIRQEVDTCPLAREFQTALFPIVDISGDPTATSGHGAFAISPTIWGPSVQEFLARHRVAP